MLRRIIRRIRKTAVMFLVNKVFAGSTRPISFSVKRKLLRSIGYHIGDNTKIVGPIFCTGSLSIGSNCWIGRNFKVHGNGTVILGDRIDVGPEVTFVTGTHEVGGAERRAGRGYNCMQTIGDGCWIGCGSFFVNEINVGNSCVVAASACVCKNVPSNVLIGGVPAKIIRNLD